MTPEEYKALAIRTEHTPDFVRLYRSKDRTSNEAHDRMIARMLHGLLGMMSELGELADQIKKHIMYGKPLDMINVVEEIGDRSWYDALFMDAINMGFETAWERNIAKLRVRYPDKFTQHAALNRDLGAERHALETPAVSPTIDFLDTPTK